MALDENLGSRGRRIRVAAIGKSFVVADERRATTTEHVIPMRAVADVSVVFRRAKGRWLWWLLLVVGAALLAASTADEAYVQNTPLSLIPGFVQAVTVAASSAMAWGWLLGITGLLGVLLARGHRDIVVRGLGGHELWGARLAAVDGAERTYRVLAQALLDHEVGEATPASVDQPGS